MRYSANCGGGVAGDLSESSKTATAAVARLQGMTLMLQCCSFQFLTDALLRLFMCSVPSWKASTYPLLGCHGTSRTSSGILMTSHLISCVRCSANYFSLTSYYSTSAGSIQAIIYLGVVASRNRIPHAVGQICLCMTERGLVTITPWVANTGGE